MAHSERQLLWSESLFTLCTPLEEMTHVTSGGEVHHDGAQYLRSSRNLPHSLWHPSSNYKKKKFNKSHLSTYHKSKHHSHTQEDLVALEEFTFKGIIHRHQRSSGNRNWGQRSPSVKNLIRSSSLEFSCDCIRRLEVTNSSLQTIVKTQTEKKECVVKENQKIQGGLTILDI